MMVIGSYIKNFRPLCGMPAWAQSAAAGFLSLGFGAVFFFRLAAKLIQ